VCECVCVCVRERERESRVCGMTFFCGLRHLNNEVSYWTQEKDSKAEEVIPLSAGALPQYPALPSLETCYLLLYALHNAVSAAGKVCVNVSVFSLLLGRFPPVKASPWIPREVISGRRFLLSGVKPPKPSSKMPSWKPRAPPRFPCR